MSMLMELVVLMNMLTLMQDGDMQMPMVEGSKEKGPGMLLQGGRLLSDSTFQMDTSMTWLHMVNSGSKYCEFCSNRILHYFPMLVSVSVCQSQA